MFWLCVPVMMYFSVTARARMAPGLVSRRATGVRSLQDQTLTLFPLAAYRRPPLPRHMARTQWPWSWTDAVMASVAGLSAFDVDSDTGGTADERAAAGCRQGQRAHACCASVP